MELFFYKYSNYFVFAFSLAVQFILIGKYLDNQVVSSYAPTAIDASDYVGRADLWQSKGFSAAFGDAYRMPGYPLLILFFQQTVPSHPYLALKIFQVVTFSFSVLLIKSMLSKTSTLKVSTWASLGYSILPIWHFTPVLIAESITTVTFSLVLLAMLKLNTLTRNFRLSAVIGLLISCLVYLKPNNLLLLVPVIVFIIFINRKFWLKICGQISLITLLILSPWVLFASHVQPGFFGLTTNSGGNLYTGTGMILDYNGSALAKSASRWKVDPVSNPKDIIENNGSKSAVELNDIYTEKTLGIWRERPLAQIRYGIDKVLIAFGLKTNSLLDSALGFITLGSIFSSILLIARGRFRPLGAALLCCMATLAFQAFVFQADRRFVVTILLPFSVIVMGTAFQLGKSTFGNRSKPL